MNDPVGLASDASGNLFIADDGNNGSARSPRQPAPSPLWPEMDFGSYSGDGGAGTSAELYLPVAVALDTSGNLFIADAQNSRIRKVAASAGIITTVAGNGTSGYSGDDGAAISAELRGPSGVAVDASGNLYIADSGNNRIRKVAATTGIITTVAGNGTAGYSGDGGVSTSAEFPTSGPPMWAMIQTMDMQWTQVR